MVIPIGDKGRDLLQGAFDDAPVFGLGENDVLFETAARDEILLLFPELVDRVRPASARPFAEGKDARNLACCHAAKAHPVLDPSGQSGLS